MSVQSTTGSRGVRINGSNAGYTMFRGSVKGSDYPLNSPPVSPSLPLPCVTVCYHISSGLYYNSILRSSIFWDVMQGRFVVNDVSERPIVFIFKGYLLFSDGLALEDGPTGCPETSATTNPRCVTSQKNVYLIYTAAVNMK